AVSSHRTPYFGSALSTLTFFLAGVIVTAEEEGPQREQGNHSHVFCRAGTTYQTTRGLLESFGDGHRTACGSGWAPPGPDHRTDDGRAERRRLAPSLPGAQRPGGLRSAGAPARAEGPARLPAQPGQDPRRRGRPPGHLRCPGPKGRFHSESGVPG